MKGWRVQNWGNRGIGYCTVVYPRGDARRHRTYPTTTMTCWCEPQLDLIRGRLLVTHYAADGRELIEAHGIN